MNIKPFKATRPLPSFAKKVAALPYDVWTLEEAKDEIKRNELSFLKVDLPLATFKDDLPKDREIINKKALENFNNLKEKGILKKDNEESFYIYTIKMNDITQTGLMSLVSCDDYLNSKIKKHELTLKDKELDRISHIESLNASTGPIFLSYKENKDADNLIEKEALKPYDISFKSEDGIIHKIRQIKDKDTIESLKKAFEKTDNFYIADGHHRSKAAVEVCLRKRKENPDKNASYNYFMAMLVPQKQVNILPYNRLIKDLNGKSPDKIIDEIKENFTVEKVDEKFSPDKKGVFGMYINNTWYKLSYNGDIIKDPYESLDVSILQNLVLSPVFHIKDPRVDPRIDFSGGIRGLSDLEKRANEDMKVAFSLYPTSIESIMNISDNNLTMPPKSTWFEPKPRSGLFIYEF